MWGSFWKRGLNSIYFAPWDDKEVKLSQGSHPDWCYAGLQVRSKHRCPHNRSWACYREERSTRTNWRPVILASHPLSAFSWKHTHESVSLIDGSLLHQPCYSLCYLIARSCWIFQKGKLGQIWSGWCRSTVGRIVHSLTRSLAFPRSLAFCRYLIWHST